MTLKIRDIINDCRYIDSHIHFQLSTQPESDASQITEEKIFSLSNGLLPGSYSNDTALCTKSEYILSCPGLHPWHAKEATASALIETINQYENESLNESGNNPIPMIGEIGLDYTWVKDSTTYPQMKRNFYETIDFASATDRSVSLHSKGAEYEIAEAMTQFKAPYLIHWYSGPKNLIHRFLDSGAYFSFGVELFYTPYIRELCRIIPIDRILPETDNPVGIPWYTDEFTSGQSIHRGHQYPDNPKAQGNANLIKQVYAEIGSIQKREYTELHRLFRKNMLHLLHLQSP